MFLRPRAVVAALVLPLLFGCGPRQTIEDAVVNASVNDVRKHLQAGYDVNARITHTASDASLVHYMASKYGRLDQLDDNRLAIIKWVLGSGANLDVRDKENATPLHTAAWFGNEQVAGMLIDYRADVNAVDRSGHTPLHLAAKRFDADMCRLLLEHGALVDARERHGETALHAVLLEAGNDHFTEGKQVVDVLLAHGADVNACDAKGSPVIRHTYRGSEMERYLRSRGATG